MVGKSKNRQELLSILKICTAPSTFNKCGKKYGPSEKSDENCYVFANSHWEILPPLLLAGGGYLGISQGLSYIFLGISQRLANSLWAFPSCFPISF
jgi:hypothetical protein